MKIQRRSPVEAAATASGARFVETGEWRTPVSFNSAELEAEAARTKLALFDASERGKLEILGADAEGFLADSLGSGPLEIGYGHAVSWGHLYRLRQDFYVGTTRGEATEIVKELQVAAHRGKGFVTLTEVTHGRSELWLVGPQSRSVMAKVCALDLQPSAFPDGAAAFGSVAKTTQLILRKDVSDLLCFALIGPRSFGDYLWKVMLEAGEEWQVAPAGTDALEILDSHRQP